MHKSRLFFFFLLVGISFSAVSQKVKYKDLFILLNAKQYDQAEPFLKKYLKENDDNPNAYLFMGIIDQERAIKVDALKETELLVQKSDSAAFFYNLALKTITEKELKKNDEYYQMYNRRDLRTGDFGVKLSDVQFDIEKRIQSLKDRKEKVAQLKKHFQQAELFYSKATAQYKFLLSKYTAEREFFLRADENQNTELFAIMHVFDSCLTAFNSYKSTSQILGKTGYNQVLNLQEIKEFGKDGFTGIDFMSDDLRLWDYKRWTQNVTDIVSKEINPIREHLISYDMAFNKLREKLRKDSVSVKNDLAQVMDVALIARLKKFDPSPLPVHIFEMKIAELAYSSEVMQNKPLRDSVNAQLQLMNARNEMNSLKKLDSIATLLSNRDLNIESENYKTFIRSAYGTTSVLRSLVSGTREFAQREKEKKAKELLKGKRPSNGYW
jgi:hypothetical protein